VPLRALRFRPEPDGGQTPSTGAAGAVHEEGAVFVVERGGALRRVALRTGLRDDQWAEVLSGDLEPGAVLAVALRGPARTEEAPLRSPFVPGRR
jgi:hypothetical protein